jgi:membrane-bound lytic murein transglycosylase A
MRGYSQASPDLPNKGQVFRKIGRRKLVPYYDRGEIEDGAIARRGLELCYLKDQTDLLFMQIQGSGRIKLDDGSTLRLNYDAHNGQPYTPVGRVLIERNIIPKEEMSMQRIREWMEANPDGAKELRRANKSYVFFREVKLADNDEAVGGQGVPLTPQRSIAVDRSLHVYGTPFFLSGVLPLTSEKTPTPFHRLMIAQDTGSAITGPARADLYFGAGADAGHVAGRLRNAVRFTILVPMVLDPSVAAVRMGLPEARPSAKIAKLFPQTPPSKDAAANSPPTAAPPAAAASAPAQTDNKTAATGKPATASNQATPAPPTPQAATVGSAVPLPQAKPELLRERGRMQHRRRHRS